MRRRSWGPVVVAAAAASVVASALVGMPAQAVAPSAASASPSGLVDGAVDQGTARLVLSEDFAARLRAKGIELAPLGDARLLGERTLEVPLLRSFADGYSLAGGIRLMSKTGQFSCPSLNVWPPTGKATLPGGMVFCVRSDGGSWPLLGIEGARTSTYASGYYTDGPQPVAPAAGAVKRINSALGASLLEPSAPIAELAAVRKRPPLKSSYDWRTSCEIDNWAGDNSINRGWALQAMVNQIPQDVTVSQSSVDAKGKAQVFTPNPPAINIGARTPNMEGISVKDSKKIIRGAWYDTDHWWEGPSYSCQTNAPFVVGPGAINDSKVKAWRYNGSQMTGGNAQWWGIPRATNYDGPTGYYTWTCRGTPNGQTDDASNAFWGKVDSGTGFVGDGQDTRKPNAGRAPACQDNVMKNLNFTTRYSISKRGGLEARSDQGTYPRSCTVTGAAPVQCWQEIYSGGWLRAWAFQYKIYASALHTQLRSDTRIAIPTGYESADTLGGTSKSLSWRIVGAQLSDGNGTWPSFSSNGKDYNFQDAEFTKRYDEQNWDANSAYTVPGGTGKTFTLGGWGTPEKAQSMTFTLVGDTDGTWTWPTSIKTGEELPRPQVRVTLGFYISNFDDGSSCKDKIMGDSSSSSTSADDKTGSHCIQGIVPTLWPLPVDGKDKRVHDAYTKDAQGNLKPTEPNIEKASVQVLNTACWPTTSFKYDDLSNYKNVPDVGANFTWDLSLSGAFNNFSGTGCN